ncbi:hypothetical protein V1512DRAFT_93524 [Lipomyces arxii]|uniref:uncharacterized protein n=1 Tax=Lipomyces arxii TaxID=56418 RepID=UPI0034CF96B9
MNRPKSSRLPFDDSNTLQSWSTLEAAHPSMHLAEVAHTRHHSSPFSNESEQEKLEPTWHSTGVGLPPSLVLAIRYLKKSETRTARNGKLYALCTKLMMVEIATYSKDGVKSRLAQEIENLQSLFQWRTEQRIKIDWLIYNLQLSSVAENASVKFANWSYPVARTFKVENILSKLLAAVPELKYEQYPHPEDLRKFPFHPRDMEYREPLLQLAYCISTSNCEFDRAVHLIRQSFIFGTISESSRITLQEVLRLHGRSDEEHICLQKKK